LLKLITLLYQFSERLV